MSSIRWAAVAALFLLFIASSTQANDDPSPSRATGPHIEVELVADRLAALRGGEIHLGLRIRADRHWHVYWGVNTGDSGEPPSVEFRLPDGASAGEILWPAPVRHIYSGLVNHIYEEEVVLPVPLRIREDYEGHKIQIEASVTWLVCRESCIPGDATLRLELPVVDEAAEADPRHAALFARAQAARPRVIPAEHVQVRRRGGTWQIDLGAGPFGQVVGSELDVEYAAAGWREIDGTAAAKARWRDGGGLQIELPRHPELAQEPDALRLVLWTGAFPNRRSWWVDAPVEPAGAKDRELGSFSPSRIHGDPSDSDTVPLVEPVDEEATEDASEGDEEESKAAAASAGGGDPEIPWITLDQARDLLGRASAEGAGVAASEEKSLTLWTAILFALLGGLILNLMPCVLPVLSLKILGFVEQAGSEPAKVRNHGFAFGFGVVASFLFLAALLLIFKPGGWGFQFQEPLFVVSMALLMFFFGLNLLGVFEVGMGVMTLAGKAESHVKRGTYLGSFASGVLATIIATPCTAPFMGLALGFALRSSDIVALSVFGALGVGMALPYVVLSLKPAWLDRLPKPGPWMVTLRQVFSFPMFAVAIGLVFVLTRQLGAIAMLWLMASFLLLALAAWLWGRYSHAVNRPRARLAWGKVVPLVLVGLTLFGSYRAAAEEPPAKQALAIDPASVAVGEWTPWSPDLVRGIRALERPVFVDYTADWCLTCKANEAALAASGDFEAAVNKHGVRFLKADWTAKDALIARALSWYQQPSVPIYIVHPPASVSDEVPAIRVGPVITPGQVIEAIEVADALAKRAASAR